METERRLTKRIKPQVVSCFQFETESGGIVLNASEQGLGFHAVAPVRQSGPIRLCVSPNPAHRINLVAEIVWMDDAKKSGGLRLKEMSEGTQTQVRSWLSLSESGMERTYFPPPGWEKSHKSEALSTVRNQAADPQVRAATCLDGFAGHMDGAGIAVPGILNIPTNNFPLAPRPVQSFGRYSSTGWLRRGARIFVVLVLASMPILFVQSFRSEFGDALIRLGEKLKRGEAHPDLPATVPAHSTTSRLEEPPAATESDREGSAKEGASLPDPVVSNRTEPKKVTTAQPNTYGVQADSRQHVRAKLSRSPLANQLWSEVESGDSKAEVALAQLYLHGDGVPRNCEQARVLLKAASKNGDIQTMRQVQKLNSSGCRWH